MESKSQNLLETKRSYHIKESCSKWRRLSCCLVASPCYFLVPFGYTRVKRYQEKKFHAAILTMSVPRLTRYFDLGVNNGIHNFVKVKVIPLPTPPSQSRKPCKALVKTAFRMEGSQRLRVTNELPAAILSKRVRWFSVRVSQHYCSI